MPSFETNTVKEQDRLKNRRSGLLVHIQAGNEEMRVTNWGRTLSITSGEATGNYTQVDTLNYEEVKRSLTLESSEMSLTVPLDGVGVQARLVTNPTVKITVKVWEVIKADLLGTSTEDNVRRIWYGKGKGLVVSKTHAQIGVRSALDAESTIGRLVYQAQDQRDPRGLVEVGPLQITASVTALSAVRDRKITIDYTPIDQSYLEGGLLIDSDGIRSRIESVKLLSGGGSELRVQFIPFGLAISDSLEIYPGYDGTLSQAINKFPGRNLLPDFSGFPYIPAVNPSVSGV
jgi:hypothetical protein